MRHFLWDASDLAKLYVPEVGSPTASAIFRTVGDGSHVTTFVGYAEALSVMLRKHHRGGFSRPALEIAISALRNDVLENPCFKIAALSDTDFVRGTAYLLRHHLNATDAAILLVFLRYAQAVASVGNSCILIASDHRLIRAAREEGLAVLNPETVTPDDLADTLSP